MLSKAHNRLSAYFFYMHPLSRKYLSCFITVANSTSLRNVVFHWLTSGFMQLARGFMLLAAAGRRRKKQHFHCLFEGQILIVH